MSTENRKTQVVMLATEKSNILKGNNGGKLLFSNLDHFRKYGTAQHLYFLSNDEIKEGDWFYKNPCTIPIQQADELTLKIKDKSWNIVEYKKIIATTNSELRIKNINGVLGLMLPRPSDEFIQKFIEEYNKGNVITEVMVEYENNYDIKYTYLPGFGENAEKIDNWKLKVAPDNTITIHPIEETWNDIIKSYSQSGDISRIGLTKYLEDNYNVPKKR